MKSRERHILEERVRETAGHRCGYCQSPQHLVLGKLEIEHQIPVSRGGTDEEENLWLACRMCNNFKASQTEAMDPQTQRCVPLFNPRKQTWTEHFAWSEDGRHIVGQTPIGRATTLALQLNNLVAITVRTNWIAAGWHPPKH